MRILSITAGAAGDVLRQLPARQRAGGRAARARPRRHAAAGLHADAHRRAERQPAPTCCSAASASTCSSTRRSSARRRASSIGCGTRQWVITLFAEPRRSRSIRRAARRADGLDAARASAASCARSSTSCSTGCATSRARRHQPAELAADRPGRPLQRALKRPVCCTLQGEDLFLDGLGEPYRQQSLDLIRAAGAARRSRSCR